MGNILKPLVLWNAILGSRYNTFDYETIDIEYRLLTYWGRDKMANIFQTTFSNAYSWISNTIWLKFVSKGPVDNNTVLVQIMAYRRIGDKPLSEPMMG